MDGELTMRMKKRNLRANVKLEKNNFIGKTKIGSISTLAGLCLYT